MRVAIAVSSASRAYAIAFGLGLAIAAMGAVLAHGQSFGISNPTEIVRPQIAPNQIAGGLLPPVPNNSFVCHAKPGGWCDLRDWHGFGQAFVN